MRIFNIIILIFLLAAFTIGISLVEQDIETIDSSIDSASININDLSLEQNLTLKNTDISGGYRILEKYIHFIGTLGLEVMRVGIHFGHDNPSYFKPEFIIKIIKLIIWLLIISLLIKPLSYLIIFIILGGIYLKEKCKKKVKGK